MSHCATYSTLGDESSPRPPRLSSFAHFQQQQQQQGGGRSATDHDPFLDPNGSPTRTRRGYDDATAGIMSGAIGSGYGPYSPTASSPSTPTARYSPRRSTHPSPFAPSSGPLCSPRIAPSSPALSASSSSSSPDAAFRLAQHRASFAASTAPTLSHSSRVIPVYTAKDALLDEKLHTPHPSDRKPARLFSGGLSFRGLLNLLALLLIVVVLVGLFAGLPVAKWAVGLADRGKTHGFWGLGGTNSSGMIPEIPNLPGLIDKDTPAEALTKVGMDGKTYRLAFSDEFNTDGRTFWPGDDPYWEAVDLHYWPTNDYEWYDTDAVTTEGGNLKITITEEPTHGMNFRSGMLQSWNKLCFTGGLVEVRISLPGANDVGGLWPGAWTLGNLGRAGYGATSDGTWPYSYNSCDLGTLPNQTNVAGTVSLACNACTCSGGDHPGPNVGVGRGAPEIDIIEAQMSWDAKSRKLRGAVSQSAQFAPYDDAYEFRNTTPYTTVYSSATELNSYKGGVYQQASSGVTYTNSTSYELNGGGFSTYGFEYDTDEKNGYITWFSDEKPDWTLTAAAVGPNSKTGVGQRLISKEPMYMILNLGISDSFQTIDYKNLKFPAHMLIDYVRIYQEPGKENIGCDPPDMPTSKYIKDHINAYSNPNLTTWAQAGYDFPKNSMQGC
ncbi:hypothetical protein JCM8097_007625 [Rhodosporidiobolus ruineniae]